jgi:hypothetical protein
MFLDVFMEYSLTSIAERMILIQMDSSMLHNLRGMFVYETL